MTQSTETQTKTATRNGVILHYTEAGAGDPSILFVHGWTCNRSHWRDQLPHFAKSHRVVAVDLRGHGDSDKPDEDYSIDGFVDDIAWLIGELGLDKPVVVGHSMGGVIALNLARQHPGLTSAIIMIDAPIFPLPEATAAIRDQLMAGFQTPAYAAIAEGFARQFFFQPDTDPKHIEEVMPTMKAPQRVTYTALRSTLAPESMVSGPISVPSLFIRAANQYASEQDLRDRYPGVGLVTVPASHFVQMEQPAATNNIITDFLDKLE